MSDWFITDDDCLQCCRPVSPADSQQYEFVQINRFPGSEDGTPLFQVAHGQVDLKDYSKDMIENVMAFYGYEECPEDRILAEMFFETDIQEYADEEFSDWNSAVARIGELTGIDVQKYLEVGEADVKKIRVYDMEALLAKENLEPFRYNKVAVFEGSRGVIVAEQEAVHQMENRITDSIVIPANNPSSPGRTWLLPEYEVTISIDELMTAPYTEMTMEEFFSRRNYNPRCQGNYTNLMSHLHQIGFDFHSYFTNEKPALADRISSAGECRDVPFSQERSGEITPER